MKPLLRLSKGEIQFSTNGGKSWTTAESVIFRGVHEAVKWKLCHAGNPRVTLINTPYICNGNLTSMKSLMMLDPLHWAANYPVTIRLCSVEGELAVLTRCRADDKGWAVTGGTISVSFSMPNYRASLDF